MNLSDRFNNLVDALAEWIPKVFGALLVFLVGWLIAYLLRRLIAEALTRVGLNRAVDRLRERSIIRRVTDNPSETIGSIVFWIVIIVTITIVIETLDIPVLNDFVNAFYGYVPNILAAIIIAIAALGVSSLLSGMTSRWMAGTATGRVAASVLPVIIMSIAGFAILDELRIAPTIVTVTYIGIIFSLSLGLALAFGLGGRDVAARVLGQAYDQSVQQADRVREDLSKGKARAQADVRKAKTEAKRRTRR